MESMSRPGDKKLQKGPKIIRDEKFPADLTETVILNTYRNEINLVDRNGKH